MNETHIRRTLRQLCKQRVAMVLQPGNVWVIDQAVEDTPENDAALKTCYIRGWVEVLENSIPKGKVNPDGSLSEGSLFSGTGPLYKVTDSGWAVVHHTQLWTLVAVVVSALSFIISVASFWAALHAR